MFGRAAAMAGALLASACVSAATPAPLPQGAAVEALLNQCADKDGWSDPAPPVRLFGNVYDVGTCGIVVLLLVGDKGHILIDTGPADAAPLVQANIERLALALSDVAFIVTSHEHHDHVGGIAELARVTGATVVAGEAARRTLQSGVYDAADPQFAIGDTFAPAHDVRLIRDGEQLRLGNLSLTMHATPGHAPGSTSWTWRTCEASVCRQVAYVDSVSAVSADNYRFGDHPDYVAMLRASLDKIAALDCDLLITPHPSASTLFERLAGDAPLSDANACRNYAQRGRDGLDARLERERAG